MTCIFLIVNHVSHAFIRLLTISRSPLENCLFRSFAHFKIGLSFHYSLVRVLYIFYIKVIYQICDLQTFSSILWTAFSLPSNTLKPTVFSLIRVQFTYFYSVTCSLGTLSNEPLPDKRYLPHKYLYLCFLLRFYRIVSYIWLFIPL